MYNKNKQQLKQLKQNGGECLGAGSFGCVLKPNISCNGSKNSKNKSKTNNKIQLVRLQPIILTIQMT